MPVYNVFIVNRAGSLIYDTDHHSPNTSAPAENTYTHPLPFVLKMVDSRAAVSFGEGNGVRVGHCVTHINGQTVRHNAKIMLDEKEVAVLDYLGDPSNYPLSIKFARPSLSSNEKIILSSMFHSLYAIAAQLSPVKPAHGIDRVDADYFSLHCHQTMTGVKLIAIVDPSSTNVDGLLLKLYELYADYALKNPFYSLDMPIRASLFDTAVDMALEKYNNKGYV